MTTIMSMTVTVAALLLFSYFSFFVSNNLHNDMYILLLVFTSDNDTNTVLVDGGGAAKIGEFRRSDGHTEKMGKKNKNDKIHTQIAQMFDRKSLVLPG